MKARTLLYTFFFILLVSITSAEELEKNYKEKIKSLFDVVKLEYADKVSLLQKFFVEEVEEEKKECRYKLGFSPYAKHLKSEHLNEGSFSNNNLLQLGIEKDNYTISITYFENSFFKDSIAIMLDKKVYIKDSDWFLKFGAGLVKGYENNRLFANKNGEERIEKSFFTVYKDFGVLAVGGVGYTFKQVDFEINMFGECLVTGVSYRF